jgi:hypothetical protein
MQVIQEENQVDNEQQIHRTTPIKRRGKNSLMKTKKRFFYIFDSDPSSCKNDLNRSGSRAADYRLPPLIETARGRIITNQYAHFPALRIYLFPFSPHY